MGAAICQRTCQHRVLRLVELQPEENDLCTRLAGAAKEVLRGSRAGGKETLGVAAGAWKCVNFSDVRIASGVGLSRRELPGQGRILAVLVLFLRGGGVREEENGQNTGWNVNWSISDVKSRVVPYSSFFSCSISLTSFLNSQL